MKPTSDKFFTDSNIFLYLFDKDGPKKEVAAIQLASNPVISTQVVAENMNVLFKKFSDRVTPEEIEAHKDNLLRDCTVVSVTVAVIKTAFDIKTRYSLQWYDSMIIAAAIEAGCSVLYSEDMQHGLVIDKTLTVLNPFLESSVIS